MRPAPRWAAGLAAWVAWLVLATPSSAQAEPLEPGREVRLFVRGVAGSFDGTLTGVRPDALTLVLRDGSFFTLNAQQVERSQVLGQRPNARRGAWMGLAVGLGAGVWLAISSRDDCLDASGFCDPGESFNEWLVVWPSLAGAAGGAAVGHFVQTPRWVPGILPGASPTAGGFALRWTLPASSTR